MRGIDRYGTEINSHDLLRISAICLMILGNVGRYLLSNNVWLRVVGSMGAPQFFFLLGYSDSDSLKRRVLLYGLALVVVSYFTDSGTGIVERLTPFNILIAFVLITALLNRFDPAKLPTEYLFPLLGILMLFSVPTYMLIEYGTLGLCYAIGARLLRQRHEFSLLWIFTTLGVHFVFALFTLPILELDVFRRTILLSIGLLLLVFIANLAVFLNHKYRVFEVDRRYVRTLATFVSRFSLEIYLLHLSAFMIISYI